MLKIRFNIGENQKALMIIAGIVALLFILLIMRPLKRKTVQLQQKIKLAEAEIKEALSVQAKKDRILKEREAYQKHLIHKSLSEQEIVNNFLKELEIIAQSSGISVVNLSPSESFKETTNLHYADLRAEGTIEHVLNFLGKLQESNLLIRAERFRLSSKGKDTQTLDLSAKLSIFTP